MTIKINNNAPAINAHRNLLLNDQALNRNLEKISTGLDIVRGSDGPASLVISEQLRSQIAGLKQAVKNTENAISMVQTTEAALEEVNRIMIDLRKLAVHASNDAANDKFTLEADQNEVKNILQALDRIATQTSFGSKKLLDGSNGVNGIAVGKDLEFVSGTTETAGSPKEGYQVKIMDLATKASYLTGDITQDVIDEGETLTLAENGRSFQYKTSEGQTLEDISKNINQLAKQNNINVQSTISQESKLLFTHQEYGSGYEFFVSSTSPGVIGEKENEPARSMDGTDIIGTIGGMQATGKGQELYGRAGTSLSGLKLRYLGDLADVTTEDENGSYVGTVLVRQNSLTFQLGADYKETSTFNLSSAFARDLARGISNESGYKSIADIDLTTFQGAQDALKLVVAASNDVSSLRGRLGAFQKDSLESTANYLRNSTENIIFSESTIRDADVAEKTAELVKNQIQLQSATVAAVHANNSPKAVITLLNSVQS